MWRRPPRLARWILSRALPPEAREFVTGDLDEEYSRTQRPKGAFRAWAWYWSQVVRSIAQTEDRTSMASVNISTHARSRRGFLFRIGQCGRDVRLSVRALRRGPGYAITALLTLGLGVGGATAIFSAVNDVLLRPLPYAQPDRLVMLSESNQERGWNQVEVAPANLFDWRERSQSFDDIAFVSPYSESISLITDAGPVPADVAQVSGNLFSVLGVPPLMGRTFREDETFTPGVAVLTFRIWQQHFASDPDIVGRTIRLDGHPHEVVGVMRPELKYPFSAADVWITPARMASRRQSIWWRQAHVIKPIGRLRAGVDINAAAAELTSIAADLATEHPDTNTGMEAEVTPLQRSLTGDRRTMLLLLLGAVCVLLLIACANVANLMLGRGLGREKELAVRAALGAGRGRLFGQMLTDSLVLSVGGTVLGLGLGKAGLSLIAAGSPEGLQALTFHLDWRLFAFSAGVCLASTVLSGIWPAWRASRVNPARHMSNAARGSSHSRLAAAHTFVVFEVALAVLLVAAAGLLLRSLDRLQRVDIGADISSVLTFDVHPSSGRFRSDASRVQFAEELAGRLESLPGVDAVGVGRGVPLTGYGWTSDFDIDDWAVGRFGSDVRHREVTSAYFTALKIPVRDGRLFESADLVPGAPIPVVVNQAFVDRYFAGESPVGRRVAFDREPTDQSYWYPIVGVVGNERRDVQSPPLPEIIAHVSGDTPSTLAFVVRTTVPPLTLVPQARAALADLDPEAPLLAPRTMEQVASDARASERFVMLLFSTFALAALLLAGIGVYGVAHQSATARTREVGIRLALGASSATVVRQLILRGVIVCGAGLLTGTTVALFAGKAIETQLFEIKPADPLTLVSVVMVIGLTAITAIVWPTWRTTRVDPIRVLRSE